jgi:RNA polymerase sigma-70 factor (ECF subfamily)
MYRVALNTAIRQLQKQKRRPVGIPIDQLVAREIESFDPEFEEQLKVLYRHIAQLNVLEKGLMLLLLEGKKYDEIAEISGLTPSNVGTRISRIKAKLKAQITNNK